MGSEEATTDLGIRELLSKKIQPIQLAPFDEALTLWGSLEEKNNEKQFA
jgi:hypothetical protein